jgi:membrane protease subunit HflC
MTKARGLIILGVVILILIMMVLFSVDETEQAIVTRMGKYVRTIKEPGLHAKLPLIETVYRFEDRLLAYDAMAREIITADKKNLVMDNYSRWRIKDPLKFYQTVRDVAGAQARLDDIVYSELREELGRHTLTEVISTHREAIMHTVAERCIEKETDYGIEIIDVRIKRADLPSAVEKSVYDRMSAERHRIARRYRSEGEEEAVKIKASTDKEKVIILADAYRKAERIKGEGDAEAIKIYAKAFERDPEFYGFLRTLEAYQKSLSEGTTVVLPSDSEFFRYLAPEVTAESAK